MTQLSAASEDTEAGAISGTHPAPRGEAAAGCVMLDALARRAVRAAFGIPGGLVSPFFDALADVPSMQLVTTRHEGMAGFAAMGRALVTGVPAMRPHHGRP